MDSLGLVLSKKKTASLFASKTSLAAFSLASAGSLAWYSHLHGFPLVGKAKAMTAAEEGLHPPAFPWSHYGPLSGYDHAR